MNQTVRPVGNAVRPLLLGIPGWRVLRHPPLFCSQCLCAFVNANLRSGRQIWCQCCDHIAFEERTVQIIFSLDFRAETMKHLDVLLAQEKFLGMCARDTAEEWLAVLCVDFASLLPVVRGDLKGDFEICFFHVLLLS